MTPLYATGNNETDVNPQKCNWDKEKKLITRIICSLSNKRKDPEQQVRCWPVHDKFTLRGDNFLEITLANSTTKIPILIRVNSTATQFPGFNYLFHK